MFLSWVGPRSLTARSSRVLAAFGRTLEVVVSANGGRLWQTSQTIP